MKKIGCLVLTCIVLSVLTACGCQHEYDAGVITKEAPCTEEGIKTFTCKLCGEKMEETISCIPHEYEEQVTKESTFDTAGERTFTCKICGDSYTQSIPIKERTVVVSVTDKINLPIDTTSGRYSNRVEFVFNIENQTDKAIRGIEGILHINDIFDKEILVINCDFTGQTIPEGSSISVSNIGIDINQFMDEHTKLYNTDFVDLQFEYEVSNIVYEDEMTENNNPSNEGENAVVDVKVVNKTNIPEDIYNGIYSPRVEFVCEVTNLSTKEIKGISGVLNVKDLFGKEILLINFDFTGQIIAPSSTVTYSDYGIDINQFMDEHLKLYNEKFEDLIFEYTVNTVVYSDGTSDSFN